MTFQNDTTILVLLGFSVAVGLERECHTMLIQKKPINKLEIAVVSSLSESYTLLPFMIFSSLLSGEAYTVNFFVPVLILYSI